MPGWFDINGLDESSPEDHAGFAEAKERIQKVAAGGDEGSSHHAFAT